MSFRERFAEKISPEPKAIEQGLVEGDGLSLGVAVAELMLQLRGTK